MSGHDPHLAAGLVHLALDLRPAPVEKGQHGFEAGGAAALGGEAEAQELVDDVAGFRPKPGDDPRARRVATQHAAVELESRHETDFVAPDLQLVAHEAQFHVGFGLRANGSIKRTLAGIGESHQLFFGDSEDRALQERGEREVVFRLEREAADRHQILHRDVVGQDEPVRAGDRYVPVLQFARQRMDEIAALAHQHHHVACRHAAIAAGDRLPPRQPAGHGPGDQFGEPCRRGGRMVDRLRPVVGRLDVLRRQ